MNLISITGDAEILRNIHYAIFFCILMVYKRDLSSKLWDSVLSNEYCETSSHKSVIYILDFSFKKLQMYFFRFYFQHAIQFQTGT